MKSFKNLSEFSDYRSNANVKKIGFVPTMGALHEGHGALLQQSVEENDLTVLSIYVNQTQFNNSTDLENYPNQLKEDLDMAQSQGVDAVLMPDFEQMYPDNFKYRLDEIEFSRELCGAHRPGHFAGVLTVVMKLLNIVKPSRAYFGEKDYQQLCLIKGMVEAFFLDVTIVGVATKRESDGLAMSSRNLNLSPKDRRLAPTLNSTLASDLSDAEASAYLNGLGFDVDYLTTLGDRRLAAASLGSVRLIDNIGLHNDSLS